MIKKQRSKLAYFSTLFVFAGFFYLMGVISRIKKPIADDLGFSELSLGVLDALIFVGAALGSLCFICKPPKKLVLTTFVLCCLISLSIQIKLLSIWFPDLSMLFFGISRFIFGLFSILPFLVQSVVTYYFDREEDECLLQVWFAMGALGDPLGILVSEFLMNNLNLSWEVATSVSLIPFLLCAFLLISSTKEIANVSQQSSNSHQIQSFKSYLKQYYSDIINVIHLLSFLLLTSLYYSMLLWLPYFFLTIGFNSNASIISISYPVAFAIGTLLLQPLTKLSPKFLGPIFLVLMLLNNATSFSLCLLSDDSSQIPLYFVLIFITAIFMSGYTSYISTTDLKNRAVGDQQFMIVNNVNSFALRIIQALSLLISGMMMKSDQKGFLKYYLILGLISTLLLMIRMCINSNSFIRKPPKQQYESI